MYLVSTFVAPTGHRSNYVKCLLQSAVDMLEDVHSYKLKHGPGVLRTHKFYIPRFNRQQIEVFKLLLDKLSCWPLSPR